MDRENEALRSRTYSWHDPAPTARAGRGMSGLDYLRAMMRGDLPSPPICATLGTRLVEVEEGRVVWEGRPAEYLYNPIATVHGGFAAALIDSAVGCAIHTLLPAGVGYTTLELKVNYVRPIAGDTGPVRCEGRVIHKGSRMATAEGRVVAGDGRLYAHGSTTCMIFASWPERGPGSASASGGGGER